MILKLDLQLARLQTLGTHKLYGWRNIDIRDDYSEKLNSLPLEVSHPFYLKNNIPGALNIIYNRLSVIERFFKAREKIFKKSGLCLIAYDGYRPVSVQEYLFYFYMKEFTIRKFPHMEMQFLVEGDLNYFKKEFERFKRADQDLLIKANKQYISFPSKGKCPSPHSTGGAIDVWLHDASGEAVDLGCEFDFMNIEAGTFYHMKWKRKKFTNEQKVIKHRELILRTMFEVGFAPYGPEFWHFSYGDQMWAMVYRKKYAKYGYIDFET